MITTNFKISNALSHEHNCHNFINENDHFDSICEQEHQQY